MSLERIQKILAHGGIASRRAAEQMITEGRVRVNGHRVTELGAKADPRTDRIEVDGERVVAEQHVYVVLHKPRGVVSTMSDPEGRPTVRELLAGAGGRVYPVGRLDFATSGVLLATNDGALAEGLLHPRKAVPKTYVLKVKGLMKPDDLDVWRKGIRLEDGMTSPADAKLIRHEGDKTWIELTIREGRNQQIRRMGDATEFPVMRLARVSFAEITSEGLAPGRWRHLTREELQALKKMYGVPKSIPAGTPLTAKRETRPAMPRATGPSRTSGPREDTRRGGGEENWGAPQKRQGRTGAQQAAPTTDRRDGPPPRGRREDAPPPRGRREDAPPPRGRREDAPPRRADGPPARREGRPSGPRRR